MRAVLLGYRSVRVGVAVDETGGRQALEGFAAREGFTLGRIFTDRDVNRPLSAFAALIEAARGPGVRMVAVPTWDDLGLSVWVRRCMRERLAREADVVVVAVQPWVSFDPAADRLASLRRVAS